MNEEVRAAGDGIRFLSQYSLVLAIIGLGGVANAMVHWKFARENGKVFDWIDLLIALVISVFSGVMFGIGAAYLSSDPLVLHGVAGLGAFAGLTGLNKVTNVMLEILQERAKSSAGVGKGGK